MKSSSLQSKHMPIGGMPLKAVDGVRQQHSSTLLETRGPGTAVASPRRPTSTLCMTTATRAVIKLRHAGVGGISWFGRLPNGFTVAGAGTKHSQEYQQQGCANVEHKNLALGSVTIIRSHASDGSGGSSMRSAICERSITTIMAKIQQRQALAWAKCYATRHASC